MLVPSLPTLSALVLSLFFFVAQSSALVVAERRNTLARTAVAPDEWTNAQRLAAGLPPHAPRHIKRATPTVGKRAAAPSPSPSHGLSHNRVVTEKAYSGHIEARTAQDDVSLGFLQLSTSGVALDTDSGTPVSFKVVGSTPFSITTASTDSPVYIGATGTAAIASGSASVAALSNVVETSPHARPAATGGESAIWTINTSTQQLTPIWVNPDGSHATTTLAYSETDHVFVLTGDTSAYNAAHPHATVSEVALYFVSN